MGKLKCHIIYPIFIDDAYFKSIYYVPILAISVFYTAMSAFYGGIFTAYKDTKILGVTSFGAAGINLIVDLVLYKFIGIYAAAISTLIAAIFMCLYRQYKIKKYVNIKDRYKGVPEILFGLVLLCFYTCSDFIKTIIFVICIILSCYVNREFILSIVSMIRRKR